MLRPVLNQHLQTLFSVIREHSLLRDSCANMLLRGFRQRTTQEEVAENEVTWQMFLNAADGSSRSERLNINLDLILVHFQVSY